MEGQGDLIMKKMIPILAHLIVWATLILIFWVTPLYDDAMGYSMLALYVVMPVFTIITSFMIGLNEEWGGRNGQSVVCMGHYLASVRDCGRLILLSGYRTSADMYNRILPFYWGPLQVFIKNNIRVDRYAMKTTCPVTVIGSDADTTLPAELQKKLAGCYADAELMIFSGIRNEDCLTSTEVIQFIKHSKNIALDTK